MDKEKRKKAIFGLRVLAVTVLTLVTLLLTILMIISWISTTTFILVFLAFFVVTLLFMWITGVKVPDPQDEVRRNAEGDNPADGFWLDPKGSHKTNPFLKKGHIDPDQDFRKDYDEKP